MEDNKPATEPVESPYVPKTDEAPKFDYNRLQDETTVVAIKKVWEYLGTKSDLLSFNHLSTREQIEENDEALAQGILEIIVENRVANNDMQKFMESFQSSLLRIFGIIARRHRELEKEYMARHIGAKDPGTGLYSREYATVGDFFTALQKIREEQNNEGYFIVNKENK